MDTRRLDYFVKIVDCGSINRAARAIGVAQPALSHHLALLEHETKVRLLDRSPTGVVMTDAGRKLYARAQVVLRQIDSLKMELQLGAHAISGVVAVGIPPSLGASLGSPLLQQVRADYPDLRLHILEDVAASLTSRLQSGLLDLLISAVRVTDNSLVGQPLFDEELLLISPPGLIEAGADMSDIAALPWIVTGSLNAIRGQLAGMFAQSGLQPNIVAEINSLSMVVRAVQQGLGVTLLPRAAVSQELLNGSVVASAAPSGAAVRTIYLYRRTTDALTPSVAAVHKIIVELSQAEPLAL